MKRTGLVTICMIQTIFLTIILGAGAALTQGKAGMSSYKDENKLIAFFWTCYV